MKTVLSTPNAPAAIGPYSQGIAAGQFVFVSGQIPINPQTGLMETDIEKATRQIFKNMEAVLVSAGLSLNNVVKTTIFMTNLSDFPKVNEIYGTIFSSPFPARSTVGVASLPKGAVIEAECIAIQK